MPAYQSATVALVGPDLPTGSSNADVHSGITHVDNRVDQHMAEDNNAQDVIAEQRALRRLAMYPCQHIANIVSEAQAGGVLSYAIVEADLVPLAPPPLPLSTSRATVSAMCAALGHLHLLGVMHRDLKPEHVLVSPLGHDIKLADFSCVSLQPTSRSLTGTPEFTAPEVLLAHEYTAVVDWWSLGCFACELLTGETPFARVDGSVELLLRKIIYDPIYLPTHPNIGALEHEFIMALLERDPNARLGTSGVNQVRAHAWLQQPA